MPTFLTVQGSDPSLTPRERLLRRVWRGLPASRVPLGYRLVAVAGSQMAVPDPGVAPLVARAIRLCRAGRPLREAHRTAGRDGLALPSGRPLSFSGFRKLVSNPFYAGYLTFEGRLYRGSHEPIVGEECFPEVKEKRVF